jgi:hypothetical protein
MTPFTKFPGGLDYPRIFLIKLVQAEFRQRQWPKSVVDHRQGAQIFSMGSVKSLYPQNRATRSVQLLIAPISPHYLSIQKKDKENIPINISSIRFKLLAGGITLVLLPLLAVGIISITKSANGFRQLGQNAMQTTAADLARLTDHILEEEIKIADIFAIDPRVVAVAEQVDKVGAASASAEIKALYQQFSSQFFRMGRNYQGIFVSDRKGLLYTGVLEDGKEYKGSDISNRAYFQQMKSHRENGGRRGGPLPGHQQPDQRVCAPIKSAPPTASSLADLRPGTEDRFSGRSGCRPKDRRDRLRLYE